MGNKRKPPTRIKTDLKNVLKNDWGRCVKSANDATKVAKDKVDPNKWSNHGLFVNQLTLGDLYFDNLSFNSVIMFISTPFETERIIPPSSGKRKRMFFWGGLV